MFCIVDRGSSDISLTHLAAILVLNRNQEISSMESEMVNLGADIQMQQENVEVKEAEIKTIKNRMDQVAAILYEGCN